MAVVAVFGAHLAVWWARFDGFDGTVLAVDTLLAVAALVAIATHIESLARERRRSAMLRLMASTYSVPRGINETAGAGVELLVAAGFADAGVAAIVRTEAGGGVATGDDALGDVAMLNAVGTAGFPEGLEEPSADSLPISAVHEFRIGREATETDRWLAPLGEDLGPRPWVARIPLHNGEETLGALLLVARHRGALQDEGLLQLIASLMGGALDYARLYQAAYDQARDLEAQDGRRREFLNAISHELRTPLTSIRAFAELLSEQRRPTRGRRRPSDDELLQSLARGVDRLSELVEDLLGLGRMEEVHDVVEVGPVELRAVLHDVETILRPAFAQAEQELHLELPEEPVWVRAETRTLEHVLMNLMSNANRHTPSGGSVDVRVIEEPTAVRVEVHDSGPGIEAADRDRIFEPFYRVQRPGVAQVPGAGLGLAIARRSAERLRGRLWVDGETAAGDGGARFCLEVPALPASEVPLPIEEPEVAPAEPDPQLRMDLVEGRGVER
ncbi:MAG: HAMP domain-containing sensor histidine kinase [Dehalococcoidia bacterium]